MREQIEALVREMRSGARHHPAIGGALNRWADTLAALAQRVREPVVTEAMVERAGDALIPDAVRDRYGYRRGMTVRRFIAEAERGDAGEVLRAALTAALTPQAQGGGEG